MYNFILQFLIMTSLAIIIYLVARATPRIDENIVFSKSKNSFFDNIAYKLPLEKIDLISSNLLEKLLRRVKIIILKIDNILTKKLGNFKSVSSSQEDLRPNLFEKLDLDSRETEQESKEEDSVK
jgi:hypothetical protein